MLLNYSFLFFSIFSHWLSSWQRQPASQAILVIFCSKNKVSKILSKQMTSDLHHKVIMEFTSNHRFSNLHASRTYMRGEKMFDLHLVFLFGFDLKGGKTGNKSSHKTKRKDASFVRCHDDNFTQTGLQIFLTSVIIKPV